MKHIAAIVHGNEFMIVLPHANLYDLEIFLRGGYEPNPNTYEQKKIYDFDINFPMLNESVILQHALVEEAHQLASALKWLHEDLRIFGSFKRYLAHMDLKPANVLLVGDPRSPAGKWMLSDFGVSLFDKETNERAADTPSIRDVGHRLTSRGSQDVIFRGHGPYQPPEVDLMNVDSRKCDVWSFGCVLCEVLAFAIGKTEAVTELRSKRYVGGNDFFYQTMAPRGQQINEIDDSNTKLKSEIVGWWQGLDYSSGSWVVEYIKVLQRALRPKPSDRPNIVDIVYSLNALAPSIRSETNGVPSPESKVPSSMDQTTGPHSQEMPSITISPEPSPPHGATLDVQDSAPQSGNQDQVLSELLSPESALHRENAAPFEHEEDGSQNSSSTEDGCESTEDAVTTGMARNLPGERSLSPPDRISVEEPTPSVGVLAFTERHKICISLPKKDKVRAIAITPSPLQIAVLCKRSVHLFSRVDGEEREQRVELSSIVDWKKIRLASQCFAVYGLGRQHEKEVSRNPEPYGLPVFPSSLLLPRAHKQRLRYSTSKACPQRLLSRTTMNQPKIYFYQIKKYLYMFMGER